MKAAPLVSHFPRATWVAAQSEKCMGEFASATKRHIGASAPLRLADEASDEKLVEVQDSRCNSKLVALLRDAQHRLLSRFVGHPLGQAASFFGSLVPIFGVVEMRGNGHGTRPFLGAAPHRLTQETPCGSCSRA